jgi:CspA family cold shock protein
MDQEWADGVVRDYDDCEGFGVIDSLTTPGGCWIHYSMIEVPGRKTLSAGQLVRFTFESDVEQDGFVFRAIRVQPSI